jgi:hypothetical protein
MKTTIDTTEHLDLAAIQEETAKFNRLRYAATQSLAEIFAATEGGMPAEAPATERAVAIRGRAAALMNGHSPASLKLPAAVSRREDLELQVSALDLVLTVYSQRELVARAEAAERFVEQHAAAWRKMCHDEVIDSVRIAARQSRAVEWRKQLFGIVPGNLPLARHVGHGRPLPDRAITEALDLGIVSKAEIEAAKNA